ncbi:hypothetical protein LWI29_029388 [Acer saccharum]|uniref:Retrotransposon gag domain-containing protein n=1 Tax=Acer saccharum TaxID=4024 RepID=A0AA39W5K2_ACESA|nr:hypothetical protein LWI29_029388 [Acer saccharum]
MQMQNCKQGNRSVEEYIDEFIRLNSQNLLPDNENMQIARFWAGLKPEIKEYMKMINTFTLGEAFDMARKAEEPVKPVKPVARGQYSSQQFQAAHNKTIGPSETGAGIAGAGVTGTGSGITGARITQSNPTQ